MKQTTILAAVMMSAVSLPALGADFLSTEPCENLFNFGVRVGVNASNRTFPSEAFNAWNVNSWGTGVDAGVVLDLNLREYISIQPGFFFESRSGNYSYAHDYVKSNKEKDDFTQLGHLRTYNFIVPVVASLKFNIADNLQWLVEAGPYVQFKLHSSDSDQIQVIDQPTADSPLKVEYAKSKFTDLGLKVGTGLRVDRHYSFSIHYLAGGCDVWKAPVSGGKNKAWTFTLGYDF